MAGQGPPRSLVVSSEPAIIDASDLERYTEVANRVPDPEIPTLGLGDLGIVREVAADPIVEGGLIVTVTPTYSGCPALEVIDADLAAALETAGAAKVTVKRSLSPAWNSSWITERGRDILRAAGIAPPLDSGQHYRSDSPCDGPTGDSATTATPTDWLPARPMPVTLGRKPTLRPSCPLCESEETELVSAFGSTACKAQYRCLSCAEPFDYFKAT